MPTNLQSIQQDTDGLANLGGWLFKHRTAIPLPFVLLLLGVPSGWSSLSLSTSQAVAGVPIVIAGELLRLWGVHHIGAISRTRSERLGPLVDTGPFSLVRNPLYLGNILLWLGFAVSARLIWLAPLIVALLMLEYHAIVRWEERLLKGRIGEPYRRYTERVPRWIPDVRGFKRAEQTGRFRWRDTLFSERGTLIAIAVGYVLLSVKAYGLGE